MVEVPKRLLIIANGNANKEASAQLGNELIAEAQNRGYSAVLEVTPSVKKAQEILEGDLEGIEAVIALGGDGTVLKVAEGLRKIILANRLQTDPEKRKHVPKLVAPQNSVGSIQVFSKELAMPSQPDQILDVIERGSIQRVQLGTVSIDGNPEEVFISNASAGLSGDLFDRDRSKGQKGGIRGYVRRAPLVISRAKYVGGNIAVIREREVNGKIAYGINRSGEKVTDVFIHNGGDFGPFPINPEKQYHSDDLAAIVFHGKTGPRRGAFREMYALLHDSRSKKPTKREDRMTGREIVIDLSGGKTVQRVKVQRDGDFLGVAEKEIRFGKDSVVLEVYTAR